MNRTWLWTGYLAAVVIVLALGYAILSEEERQISAAADIVADDITTATDLYAENCTICHGAGGEGILATPPLNSDVVRTMDELVLLKTISRGRYNTTMAAWAVDEGGVFSHAQIGQLITLLQFGNWADVEQRVADLGLTPPEPIVIEVDEATLAQIEQLPNGQSIASGLQIYSDTCVACHGTGVAPALDAPDLPTRLTDSDLARIISEGVPGTTMVSWSNSLSGQEITDMVAFIRSMPTLSEQGIMLPNAPAPLAVEVTPELVAKGQNFYNLLCVQCHGVDGFGSPMAPALHAQPFLSDTPDAAIMQIISNGVAGTVMPAWEGYLSENDIQAVVAFLRSWEATAPPIVQ